MDSSQLMAAERQRLVANVVRQRNYLSDLVKRMRELAFPAEDPLLVSAEKALDGVQGLLETTIAMGRRK